MPKGITKEVNWTKLSERLLSFTSNGKVQNQKAVLKLLEKIHQNSRTISSNDIRVSRIGKNVNDIRRNNRDLVQVSKLAKQIVSNFQKLAQTSQSSQPCTPASVRNKTPFNQKRVAQTPSNGASPCLSRLAQKTPVNARTPLPMKSQPPVKKEPPSQNHVQLKGSNQQPSEIQSSGRKAGRKRTAPSNFTPTATCSKRLKPSSPQQKTLPQEEPKRSLPPLKLKFKFTKDSKANYKVQENGTKPETHGNQTNGCQQQHVAPSPPDFDSLDSDRTPCNGASVESRVSPASRDSWANQSASTSNQPIKAEQIKPENPEVFFDVKTDPYFCSTIATGPPSGSSNAPEEERHGWNGCYGDNGKFYEWKDTILLKHKYNSSVGEPINDNLLVIMPYCDID